MPLVLQSVAFFLSLKCYNLHTLLSAAELTVEEAMWLGKWCKWSTFTKRKECLLGCLFSMVRSRIQVALGRCNHEYKLLGRCAVYVWLGSCMLVKWKWMHLYFSMVWSQMQLD